MRVDTTIEFMSTRDVAIIAVCLTASSIVAIVAMIHGAGKFEWNWFYPWVIGPYIILLGIFCLPRRQTDSRAFAGCTSAMTVLVFSCWFYIGAMWFSGSSTSALVFIFAPIYLFVGGLVVWGSAWFVLSRHHRTK